MQSILSPAKINLNLHITGKKETDPFCGYHTIESLISFVSIGDTLSITPHKKGCINITTSGDFAHLIPDNGENLAVKAVDLVRPDTTYGCDIHIEKKLPVGGGVGGGSSNAGTVIRALCQIWDVAYPHNTTLAKLGSDIPMCVHCQDGQASGIGDIFTPITLPNYYIVIAYPHIPIYTVDIYHNFHDYSTYSTAPTIPETMEYQSFIRYLHQGDNDLAPVCMHLHPQVKNCLNIIQKTNPDYCNISGSGACCYGIYQNKKEAETALENIKMHNFWAYAGHKI